MNNAMRAAGRGSIARPPKPPPSTPTGRDAVRPSQPARPNGGRGGSPPKSAHTRMSVLATSVLDQRDQRDQRQHRQRQGGPANIWETERSSASSPSRDGMDKEGSSSFTRRAGRAGGYNFTGGMRRKPAMDWYSSAARTEALEEFKMMSGGGADADVEGGGSDETQGDGFGWGNVSAVLDELPRDHWATSYVKNVAYSLEGNGSMSGRDKQEILNETLSTLSALSQIHGEGEKEGAGKDERFCDA